MNPTLLVVVLNRLRRGFAQFKLGAHFLDLRGLFFHRCCETRNRAFQFRDPPLLFAQFIRTHNERFPSSRCASATKIACPVELIVETQPQLQAALLSLFAAQTLATTVKRPGRLAQW